MFCLLEKCYHLFSPDHSLHLPNKMSSKREREPDLTQYRFEYVINNDFPVEMFFMALNPGSAVKMFAQASIKFLSGQNLSEDVINCFVEAFANPQNSSFQAPGMIPLPKPIPDLEKPKEEMNEFAIVSEEREKASKAKGPDTFEVLGAQLENDADPFINSDNKGEIMVSEPAACSEAFASPPQEKIPDPAIEHARIQAERDAEILQVKAENERRISEFENMTQLALSKVEELNRKITITTFEEHNRWIDKWQPLAYPVSENNEGGDFSEDKL